MDILLLFIILYGILYILTQPKKNKRKVKKNKIQQSFLRAMNNSKNKDFSYSKFRKKEILTKAEKQFYFILQKEIKSEYKIIPQAVLSAFIDCNEFLYRNKINRKTIDFLIVDNQLNIVCGIELDDKSHNKYKRIKRDEFVNSVFNHIDIKLLRIKMSKNYKEQLKELLPEEIIYS